ncbi:TPA: hypothetical protein NEG48_003080 [Elizabethkingia anophelis]|nr:hypothetical protein [Elizabethkingia anophelis]
MKKIPIFFIVSATYKADDGILRCARISYSLDEIYTGVSGICKGLRKEFKGSFLEKLLITPGIEHFVKIDPAGEVAHTIARVNEIDYKKYNSRQR